MYRGRLWTMRQFAGFGSAENTNERFHYLLKHGVDGLSVAFDMPTLMGRDSDDPLSRGEVGREGVAVDTLRDVEILFDKIPLDRVTTSMTINGPASIVWAMYLAAAETRGIPLNRLGGTIQNDALKEYIAQREWIVPVKPAMNLVADTFRYGSRDVPRWNTISISRYPIRGAGATALQELAFTLIDGLEYVKWGVEAGLDVDDFVPHLSFFFDVHNDFFDEIAKFRAARHLDRKSTRLNSSHSQISYAAFCSKKKNRTPSVVRISSSSDSTPGRSLRSTLLRRCVSCAATSLASSTSMSCICARGTSARSTLSG